MFVNEIEKTPSCGETLFSEAATNSVSIERRFTSVAECISITS
jgi:hypothetical protein